MFLYLFLFPLLVVLPLHLSVLTARLANAPVLGWGDWAPLLVFAFALVVVAGFLKFSKYEGNLAVPALALTLCGIGIAFQFRIGTIRFTDTISPSQLAFPMGIIAMLATYRLARRGRVARLEPLWFVFLSVSVLVILFVLVAGRRYRGAVYLPGNVNPVEIVKPLLVVFIASMLAGHSKLLRRGFLGVPLPPLNIIVTLGILWAPPMLMLALQGDMGMFALMNATLVVMLFAATGRTVYLLGGFAAIFALARLAIPLTTRGRMRLAAWADPFSVATGAGWQPLHGLTALYTGGWHGTGVGAGAPTTVPIAESDFVYIIPGEELGFIGCIVIVLLYVTLFVAGTRVAEKSSHPYAATVCTGLTACLTLQTLLNIGGVVKALPLTGIPLPLISHGGSSMVTTLLMIGLMMAISDEKADEKKPKVKPKPQKTTQTKPAAKPQDSRH